MADEKKLKMGQNVYETFCQMFDDMNFKYQRHDDDLRITLTVRGDDIPMDMIIVIDADREIVRLLSPMPFNIPEDKRMEAAVAVAVANYGLVDGSFDYDMRDGEIRFRLTASYIESILGKEQFRYMVGVSASTIDTYNDRFLMLAKGLMSLEQFIEQDKA